MLPGALQLVASALEALRTHAAAAAPDECCGVLLGHGDTVERYVPLHNVARTPRTAFAFDDAEWLRVARDADEQGLEVVGLAHSHLDTAAEPSGADRALGDATPWMLIVPVVAGAAGLPRAWRRSDDRWNEANLGAFE